jgi:hypothetical protein
MEVTVIQKNKKASPRGILLRAVSTVVITSMVFPLLIVDVCCSVYHAVYFRLKGIPLIPRGRYIVLDRGRLRGLNWVQRWNCAYCDYANGLIEWTKAVINTTEVYNCAIKHGSAAHALDHQKGYFAYRDFQ